MLAVALDAIDGTVAETIATVLFVVALFGLFWLRDLVR